MSLFSIRFRCGCNRENKLHLHFVLGMYPSLHTFIVFDVSKVNQLLYDCFSQTVVDRQSSLYQNILIYVFIYIFIFFYKIYLEWGKSMHEHYCVCMHEYLLLVEVNLP